MNCFKINNDTMKFGKTILATAILFLFLISSHTYGQSKSKEALGNALVKSIKSKNVDSFKALLIPQNVALNLLENEAPESNDEEERDELRAESEATYNNVLIPQYEDNFWEMVNRNETSKIDWGNLNFVILYKYASKDEDYIPFLIHSKLVNSDYNHFYFSAVRYKGEWYLEDKMEITKGEKYAEHE